MAGEKKILTYAGLRALEDELENLKVVKRKEVVEHYRARLAGVEGIKLCEEIVSNRCKLYFDGSNGCKSDL